MIYMEEKMNKIHNIDCLEFMKQVPDGYFDLVLTDPPYGTTQNEWDSVVNMASWWKEIHRITKEDTAIISFSAQPFTTELIKSNIDNFRYSLVWDKVLPVGFLNANKMPLRRHEDVNIFYRKLPYYNPEKTKGHERKQVAKRNSKNNNNYGDFESVDKYPTSILKFSNGGTRTQIEHPTQKPIELIKYLLRLYGFAGVEIYSKDEKTKRIEGKFKVFDPFMGSGTTAVACKSLGLEWCGCEIESDYVEIANKRLESVQGSLF